MKSTVIRTLFRFLFLFSLSSYLYAVDTKPAKPDSPPQSLDELKAKIEEIRKETNTPAVGVALVNKDGPLWIAGLGEANLEKHIKADENTMFRIASASKMFVGLSVLKLVEQGKLHLDDKLHDLAPEIEFNNPWEASHPILIAHLLAHTTGWDTRPSEYQNEAPDSMRLKEGLSDPMRVKARTSRWMPGTRHAYSNTGPVVAAYVVEKIAQQKYEDFVQENFFNPLQMNSSTFYKSAEYLKRGAVLYVNGKPEKYAQVYSRPSSSVNTSVKDMAQLLQFFIQKGSVNGIAILHPDSIQKMQTPTTTLGAEQGITAGYGLTMEIHANKNFAMVGHNGGLPGAITQFSYLPELNSGFVLMLNASNGEAYWKISSVIEEFLLKDARKEQAKAIPLPQKYKNLTGYYAPTNPDSDLTRLVSNLTETIKISTDAKQLHRKPVLGDWSNDYVAVNDSNLINAKTDMPTLAIVQDPLLGEVVQIASTSYQRVSAVSVYARLGLTAGLAVLSIISLLFALVWIPRRLWGALPGV